MSGRRGRAGAALGSILLLAACSGGSSIDGIEASGDGPVDDPSFAVGTQNAGTLTFTGFEGDGTPVDAEAQVVLATGVVTGSAFAGLLDAARSRIDLDGGAGTVTLTNPGATEYLRIFTREASGGDPSFGVVGFPSPPGDLPRSGQVSYTGAARVTATDATRIYALDGTAYVEADFGEDRVLVELRDLEGTAQGISAGNSGPVAVSGGGIIAIDGSRLSGATFSGGTASATGLPFEIGGGADTSGTKGGFFGPDADEVGGRIVIDDAAGSVAVLGTYAAD